MRAISPAARTIQLDTSEGPDQYWLVTLNADGELVDFLGDFTDSETAHAAAEAAVREYKLPYVIRDIPYGLG